MRYAVVIEKKADGKCSAYAPDLPGCVATGDTPEQARQEISEAIKLHLEGLKKDGVEAPKPRTVLVYVEA
jgi:predicted RNase H-like HicB family nuclease